MWDFTCQPLYHSNCDKVTMRHGQLATTSRRGKVPNFKLKAPSFHTTEFSYLNYFPSKIDQIFGFWAGQGLKLRRNTCFFNLSLLWPRHSTYQNLKGWLSQKCELQSFVFQKVSIWQQPLANQLGGFEYNFRCLKRFFRKVQRKLRSAFSLKLRFLKIRLLVTWLKCLSKAYNVPPRRFHGSCVHDIEGWYKI